MANSNKPGDSLNTILITIEAIVLVLGLLSVISGFFHRKTWLKCAGFVLIIATIGLIWGIGKIQTSQKEAVREESMDLILLDTSERERKEMLNREDEFRKEIEKHEAPLSIKKRATVLYQKGYDLLKNKLHNEAIEHLKLSYENIETGTASFYLGRSYSEINKPKEAIKWYKNTIKFPLVDQNKAIALFNMGCILKDLREYQEAKSTFEESLRYNPEYFPIQ